MAVKGDGGFDGNSPVSELMIAVGKSSIILIVAVVGIVIKNGMI